MRKHEDGRVIRWLIAPPSLPTVVQPWASDRTEHVSSKDPGTYFSKALLRKAVIDTCLSIIISVHLPPYARPEEPLHELGPTNAERILKVLVRSSPVAVDGYRKALDAEFRHKIPLG